MRHLIVVFVRLATVAHAGDDTWTELVSKSGKIAITRSFGSSTASRVCKGTSMTSTRSPVSGWRERLELLSRSISSV